MHWLVRSRPFVLPLALALAVAASAAPLAGCASFEAARCFQRGTAALDRGDAAGAVGELERAATLEPHASAVHNHLGIAYEAAGREEDALRAYERAVELDCENRAAERNLAALRARRARAGAP
jgi:Flp pilus assembly protein TadD